MCCMRCKTLLCLDLRENILYNAVGQKVQNNILLLTFLTFIRTFLLNIYRRRWSKAFKVRKRDAGEAMII